MDDEFFEFFDKVGTESAWVESCHDCKYGIYQPEKSSIQSGEDDTMKKHNVYVCTYGKPIGRWRVLTENCEYWEENE